MLKLASDCKMDYRDGTATELIILPLAYMDGEAVLSHCHMDAATSVMKHVTCRLCYYISPISFPIPAEQPRQAALRRKETLGAIVIDRVHEQMVPNQTRGNMNDTDASSRCHLGLSSEFQD
jgi:hypothetical protein